MSGETIVVAAPAAAPETTETAAPAVSDALQVAETIVEKAQDIAAEMRVDENRADRGEEIIALLSEVRDLCRDLRTVADEILTVSRETQALQTIDILADEMEPAPAPAEPAPAAIVEVAAGDGVIEKETVVETGTAPAEIREEKKTGRRWL